MRAYSLCIALLLAIPFSCAQDRANAQLIGACEGCEAVFEHSDRELSPSITLPGFENGETRIKISGTIFQNDGVTPAEGVILYVYHTDEEGLYSPGANPVGWERRHGDDRGWIKTGADGRYTFYTFKPGTYPDHREAAHIHPTILEPNGKYYYADSYFFEGDPLLTREQINPRSPRCGSPGVVALIRDGDLWVGSRDFVLGRNIPGW